MTLKPQKITRQGLALLAYYSGFNSARELLLRGIYGQRLIVLAYHGVEDSPLNNDLFTVSTNQFEKQMRYIKERYNAITISDALTMERPHDSGDSIIITFDDGYKNNFTNAMPILQKYKLNACFFLTTDLIGHVPGQTSRTGGFWKFPGMTWEEVKAMRDAGFEIGAHTCSHPNLAQIPLPNARSEIIGSKNQLEQVLRQKIEYFAYPGGRKGIHYDDAVKAIVAKEFRACCTTSRARNSFPSLDRWEISRICVQNWWSLFYFARELEGTFDFVGSLIN